MAPTRTKDERMVSRTYRAAIRLGEDYVTIEETITLPIDASDDEIAQAVDTGWRLYAAQKDAAEVQIASLREGQPQPTIAIRDPESPASEKQRNFVSVLQDDLHWSDEQLARYAQEQSVDVVTMTKGQASGFIDGLKRLAEERATYQPEAGQPAAAASQAPAAERPRSSTPASEKQLRALHQIAQERGVDLDAECRERYEITADELSLEQASTLLTAWQRPRNGQRRAEPAL